MRLNRLLRDESGLVMRWVIGIIVAGALFVLVLVAVGPILWIRIAGIQDAEDLATTVAQEYYMRKDTAEAVQAAGSSMQMRGYTDQEIREAAVVFLPQGAPSNAYTSVRITVVKYVDTILTKLIKATRKWGRVSITKEAPIGPEKPEASMP